MFSLCLAGLLTFLAIPIVLVAHLSGIGGQPMQWIGLVPPALVPLRHPILVWVIAGCALSVVACGCQVKEIPAAIALLGIGVGTLYDIVE